MGASIAWDDGVPRLYDHASGKYLESVKEMRWARRVEKARADAAETRADAYAAQRDMTELQLESAIRTRDAAQAENRRLRELIRRLENR